MKEEDKFKQAKELAIALSYLQIKKKLKNAKIEIIGFFNRAKQFNFEELLEVGIQYTQPFTNLKEGLGLARAVIRKNRFDENIIIIITDGRPTAILENDMLRVELDESKADSKIVNESLKELREIIKQGTIVNFILFTALEENANFVEEARKIINGGIYVLENSSMLKDKFITQVRQYISPF